MGEEQIQGQPEFKPEEELGRIVPVEVTEATEQQGIYGQAPETTFGGGQVEETNQNLVSTENDTDKHQREVPDENSDKAKKTTETQQLVHNAISAIRDSGLPESLKEQKVKELSENADELSRRAREQYEADEAIINEATSEVIDKTLAIAQGEPTKYTYGTKLREVSYGLRKLGYARQDTSELDRKDAVLDALLDFLGGEELAVVDEYLDNPDWRIVYSPRLPVRLEISRHGSLFTTNRYTGESPDLIQKVYMQRVSADDYEKVRNGAKIQGNNGTQLSL